MIISCAPTWNGDNKCHARCLRSHLNVNKYIGMAILEPNRYIPLPSKLRAHWKKQSSPQSAVVVLTRSIRHLGITDEAHSRGGWALSSIRRSILGARTLFHLGFLHFAYTITRAIPTVSVGNIGHGRSLRCCTGWLIATTVPKASTRWWHANLSTRIRGRIDVIGRSRP